MNGGTIRALVLVAGLAAATARAGDDPQASAIEAALAAAEVLRAKAVEAGHEWLGVRSLLDEARAAAASGDTAGALQLAERARQDCELALEQARREEEAWQNRVLR
jgi:hypothetical protein